MTGFMLSSPLDVAFFVWNALWMAIVLLAMLGLKPEDFTR